MNVIHPQTPQDWLGMAGLVVIGFIGSGINAIAGGGSLITFPLLLWMGIPSVQANATNSTSLWPGSLSGAVGFLPYLRQVRSLLIWMLPITAVGAFLGATIFLNTDPKDFDVAVPLLLGVASLLVAFQPWFKAKLEEKGRGIHLFQGFFFQFLISLYGGYFGAGMGVLMLGAMALFVIGDIHRLNAIKQWLAVTVNITAMAVFLSRPDTVLLYPAIALTAGAIMGGFLAAKWSLKTQAETIRIAIVFYGAGMTLYFGIRALLER